MTHPTDADVEAMALLPCPFCGGEAIVINHRWSGNNEIKAYYVHCIKCNANGHGRNTKEKAIAAWNRRAIPAHYIRAVEEREGLIEALKPFFEEADRWAAWAKVLEFTDYELSHHTGKVKASAFLNLRAILPRATAPTPEASTTATKGER